MNDLKSKTACFTGHRNIPPEELPMVIKRLKEAVSACIKNGYRYFGSGGARGFDLEAAMAVLELKKVYPDIKLILVLPCREQTRGWSATDVQKYEWIKARADKVVYTSEHYYNGCMQKRNRHLVDHSSLCICYYTRQRGGTAFTVDYASNIGLIITNLA